MQAAVLLCSYRGASAFFSAATPRATSSAALRRTSAAAASSSSASSCVRVAIASARQAQPLRAADSGGSESKVVEDFGANVEVDPKRVSVLFDFDGTIGDTETPAMEVAFWELAPYFPEAASESYIWCIWRMVHIRHRFQQQTVHVHSSYIIRMPKAEHHLLRLSCIL